MKFPHNKQLPKDAKDAAKVQHEFDNEVEVLVHLRKVPQHIVMLIGFNPQERALAMEAMLGGDLSKQKAPLALPHVKTLVENVLKGVADCHEHHVAHRDIKEEQFSFVKRLDATATSSKDWSTPLKLLDFGEAIQFKKSMGFRKSSIKAWTAEELRGTPTYVSPEWAFNMLNAGKEKKFSAYAPDIWAVGVIAYQLATGKEFTAELFKQVESHAPQSSRSTWSAGTSPFSFWKRIYEATDADIQNVIFHGLIQQQLAEYSGGPHLATLASNFLERCLKKDPSHRMVTGSEEMTARELLKDPWFST
jgi:serine/threonine protein kinase